MATMRSKILAIGAAVCAILYLCPDLALARGGGGHGGGGRGGGGHFSGGHFSGGQAGGARIGGGHFGGAHISRGIGGVHAFRGARIGGLRIHNLSAARAFLGGRHFRSFSRAHIRTAGPGRISRSHITRVTAGAAAGALGARAAWHHWGNHHWKGNWHSWHGGWGGWAGPVYWPYFFGDLFAFSFWPYGYFDPFWAYGDWFVWDAVFWPGPYEIYEPVYVYGPEPYAIYARPERLEAKRSPVRASPETTASIEQPVQSCGGIAPGLPDLPVERIEKALQLSGDQRILLHALNLAATQASEKAKTACANALPLTPLGRLDAVEKRIDSLTEASDAIRPPLDAFYRSLSDDQQAALRELGKAPAAQARRRPAASNDLAALCRQGADRFTQLPIERVQESVKPTQEQAQLFDQLKMASADAAAELRSSCPAQTPEAPLDRFDAVRTRLIAMRQAIETVRPALASFYAALSDEQKARFNVLGAPKARASRT
jgi:hypothetical protein